jgi:hypothetical protein
MQKLISIGLLFCAHWLLAQSGISSDYCLERLEELQSKKDGFYPIGIFPTQRYWLSAQGEEDNNVVGTAHIAYILRTVQERKPNPRVEKLIHRTMQSFENYRSRRGEAAYNHWQTIGEDLPFPNSSLLAHERWRLPDDYGNSALIQLARGMHPMDDAVRTKMVSYALRSDRKDVADFPSEHRSRKVYEVWYADKMPQELDLVIMANALLFVLEKEYSLETPDLHTIDCLKAGINEKWCFKDPNSYSPYYRSSSIILYSLARVVAADRAGLLDAQRKELIRQLHLALGQAEHAIDTILIASSLYRLGESMTISLSQDQLLQDVGTFIYYTYSSPTLIMRMLPSINWRSEAVSWALMYELLSFEPSIHWH